MKSKNLEDIELVNNFFRFNTKMTKEGLVFAILNAYIDTVQIIPKYWLEWKILNIEDLHTRIKCNYDLV